MESFDSEYKKYHKKLTDILKEAESQIVLKEGEENPAAGIKVKKQLQEMILKLEDGTFDPPEVPNGFWEKSLYYGKLLKCVYDVGAAVKLAMGILGSISTGGFAGATIAVIQLGQLAKEVDGLLRELWRYAKDFMKKREEGVEKDEAMDVKFSDIILLLGDNWKEEYCVIEAGAPSTSGSGGGDGGQDGGEEPPADH